MKKAPCQQEVVGTEYWTPSTQIQLWWFQQYLFIAFLAIDGLNKERKLMGDRINTWVIFVWNNISHQEIQTSSWLVVECKMKYVIVDTAMNMSLRQATWPGWKVQTLYPKWNICGIMLYTGEKIIKKSEFFQVSLINQPHNQNTLRNWKYWEIYFQVKIPNHKKKV